MQQATANLERDSAQAANAKVIMQRYEDLVQRGIVAREQRDTARAVVAALEGTLAADRAAVENAKVQLQYATIRAPIAGRTGALMVNAGNLVRANDQTPLVTINQVTPIYVSFAFPEAALSDLRRYMAQGAAARRGGPVDGRWPSRRRPHHVRGQCRRSNDGNDQDQGNVSQRGSNALARPVRQRRGPAGDRIRGDRRADRLPSRPARMERTSTSSRTDKTVELRPVIVARAAGTETVIKQGLAAGDIVVTDGHLRLVPGSRVSLRDESGAKAGS